MTLEVEIATRMAERIGKLGWYVWDRETSAVKYSPGLRSLLQVGDSPASVELYLSVVHPDDRAGAGERGRRARELGVPFSNDYRLLRADGTTIWVHARGESHELDGRSVIIGVVVDVSELMNAEILTQKLNDRLVESLRVAQSLIAVMEANGLHV